MYDTEKRVELVKKRVLEKYGFVSCPVSAADTGVETRENTMELQSSAA